MIQGRLTFWGAETDFITYSELTAFRVEEYARRGPGLVKQSLRAIEHYETDPESFEDLKTLNHASTLLAALNPLWSDFSTEVFRACLSPTLTSPKQVKSAFELTLKRIERSNTAVAA